MTGCKGKKTRKVPTRADHPLRIIGGKFRRTVLKYSGDPATRPMKDRVREAVFNLLGKAVQGTVAIDLFAGTGAIGLEAISRGADQAIFFERSHATARILRKNAASLSVADRTETVVADTLLWFRRHPLEDGRVDPAGTTFAEGELRPAMTADKPWCVFFSPPWELFTSRGDDMLWLIAQFMRHAPRGSLIIVESDEAFDLQALSRFEDWDVRHYPPAVIAIWE
ncbi:MAG: RsmD family RNA methyltransferase [Pirellulales bacterium]|nr:RsmD family RNA methyltransferase [Pirellulales bacterium]